MAKQSKSEDELLEGLEPGEELPCVVAINEAVGKLYGGKFAHSWATVLSWELGGPDPLDRIRCYRANDHWHYVGYGCSDLVEKSHPDSPLSGFGFELTFRLRRHEEQPPAWPAVMMQHLVRYVWDSKNYFRVGEWMPYGPKWKQAFRIDGILFAEDPEVPPIETENGRVTFIQVVGVPQQTIDRIAANANVWDDELAALKEKNPLLVTDPV